MNSKKITQVILSSFIHLVRKFYFPLHKIQFLNIEVKNLQPFTCLVLLQIPARRGV